MLAMLICRRRTFPTLGQGGQQRPNALPMSHLSLSVDLEFGPVAVSP